MVQQKLSPGVTDKTKNLTLINTLRNDSIYDRVNDLISTFVVFERFSAPPGVPEPPDLEI